MSITLRPMTRADIPSLVQLANDWEIAKFMTDRFPHPYTEKEAEAFLKFVHEKDPTTVFAIELDGQFIGAAGVHPQDDVRKKNAELGYWVGRAYWGHGYATEAVRQIVQYGFKTFDIDRVFGSVYGSNIGSQKVLEKLGFTLEAKFHETIYKKDHFEDELVYAVRRG